MKSSKRFISRGRVIALIAAMGVGLASLGAAPVAADPPIEFSDSVTFEDVNPCTGEPMEITINSQVTLHEGHKNNFVVHVAKTGTTSDGYVMDHGSESFVANNNVVRGSFTDNWRHPDGSKFKAQGVFVETVDPHDHLVDKFRLRCL